MSEFKKNIDEYHDVSLDNIKCAAVNALPSQYRYKPWCITNKGGSDEDNTIYTEELQLNAYLASYTDWHKGKLAKAFTLLNEPLPRQINIIDWACGQGIATLFILSLSVMESEVTFTTSLSSFRHSLLSSSNLA